MSIDASRAPLSPRVAVFGAGGMLGRAVIGTMPRRCRVFALTRTDCDMRDAFQVRSVLERLRPDIIINCAAYTDVDGAETDGETARIVNGEVPARLAMISRDFDATLVHISTDFVFDGTTDHPYGEEDATAPLSVYGRTKREGERGIQASGLTRYYIVRTSWLFGPGGNNFAATMARLARSKQELRVVTDQRGCPTYTEDLARALYALLGLHRRGAVMAPSGLYHFCNAGACSRYEWAAAVVDTLHRLRIPLALQRLVPVVSGAFPAPATRPAFSVLSTDKFRAVTGQEIAPWQERLPVFLDHLCKTG